MSTQMTPADAAKQLDGCEYRSEGSPQLFAKMKAAGLVAVFGASDDLVELRGAAYDEIGAYEGTTIYFTPSGLLENECAETDCPYFAKLQQSAVPVEAIWDESGYPWRYETKIPHVKFVIREDGRHYCEGIVFALKDVPHD